MEHVAGSAAEENDPEFSRSRRRSLSVDSNKKRTRLGATNDSHDVPLHPARYVSPYVLQAPPPPAATATAYPPVFSPALRGRSGSQACSGADHDSRPTVPPNADTFDAPPSSWTGSSPHPTSFPALSMTPSIIQTSALRRNLSHWDGTQWATSPNGSSGARGDGTKSFLPPIHPYGESSFDTPPESDGGMQQRYAGHVDGFSASLPPVHGPFSTTPDFSSISARGIQLSSQSGTFDSHPEFQGATLSATSSLSIAPGPAAFDAFPRHLQQGVMYTNYVPSPTQQPTGTSAPSLSARAGSQPNHTQPPRAAPPLTHTPAAPLQSILHPVNLSPKLRQAEAVTQPKTDSQAAAGAECRDVDGRLPDVHSNDYLHTLSDSFEASPAVADKTSEAPETGNQIWIVAPASAEEAARSRHRSERRWRSNFTVDQRNETSQTRAIGACLRCKSQRVRCVPSPLGPFHTCLTCEQVSKNSKKVLHDIRCIRWRMLAMTTFRNGGLNLTRRWEGTTVQDVGDWKDSKTIEIEMKLFYTSHMHRYDLCDVPLKFHVRAFIPTKGDVVSRKWIKKVKLPDGSIVFQKRYVHFPPFALADAHATVEIFRDYFEKNAIGAMLHVAQFSHPVVREHFEAAVEHLYSLPDGDVEKFFLQKFIKLWFCVRFTTGTDYLSGTEKLGCLPVPDADYPLGDRISVPRMITAQGDSIIVSRLLRPLTQELIPELEKIFRIGNPDNWFLLYVCTFILLSEISFSCQDRRRHAQENWLKQKYTLPEFVGELQFGTNIILCYWHYYRTMDPMDDGWDVFCKTIQPPTRPRAEIESAKGKGKKRVHLTHSQRALVTRHWRSMVETANMMDTPEYRECYEHPLYFVCQMYTKGWQIRDHYKRGPPDEPEDIA